MSLGKVVGWFLNAIGIIIIFFVGVFSRSSAAWECVVAGIVSLFLLWLGISFISADSFGQGYRAASRTYSRDHRENSQP